MIKKILKYIGIFLGVLFLMVGALDLVAKIPRSAIGENSVKSAEYMQVRSEYEKRIGGLESTESDYYADSISLSINYALDPNDGLKSVVLAKFATDEPFVTQEFIEQVKNGMKADQEYLRYWHGYLVVLRPLMVVFSIEQIYLLSTAVICGLMIAIIAILYKHKEMAAMISFTISMVAVWFFIVPTALEFTWMFMLMLVECLIVASLVWRGKEKCVPALIFIFGMLAAYFDFLTTETITLTMPLILAVWLSRKKNIKGGMVHFGIKCAGLWLAAFICTWVMKWVIAGIVLGENVWPYVNGSVLERLGADNWFNNPILLVIFSVMNNINNLMFFNTGIIGGLITISFAVTIFVFLRNYRCKEYNNELVKTLLLICLVPLIRFLVLRNHSFQHSLFVFRALCAPIFAGILIVVEKVDWKKLRKELKIKK